MNAEAQPNKGMNRTREAAGLLSSELSARRLSPAIAVMKRGFATTDENAIQWL